MIHIQSDAAPIIPMLDVSTDSSLVTICVVNPEILEKLANFYLFAVGRLFGEEGRVLGSRMIKNLRILWHFVYFVSLCVFCFVCVTL